MADHIPFITSVESVDLVKSYYSDSEIVRLPLDHADKVRRLLHSRIKLWLDPRVDGMHHLGNPRNEWVRFMNAFPDFKRICAPTFPARSTTAEVYPFVKAIMDACAKHKPTWITVPQLPLATEPSRNKLNLSLAEATGRWRSSRGFAGRLILPLIFTHQDQVRGKTQRNPHVKQAKRRYDAAQADGIWTVESSLSDEKGSSTLRKRFSSVILLHEELNDHIPCNIRIAGPYWGLNLVLWARNLVDYPAIGIGTGYQYLLAGGLARRPSAKVAMRALRRRVGVKGLEQWLESAMETLGPSHPTYAEFREIKKNLTALSDVAVAKEQVAEAYKEWLDTIAAVPRMGRSLALFQDLSAAYALGKFLPPFSSDEKTARRPEAVAEPLMLSCL